MMKINIVSAIFSLLVIGFTISCANGQGKPNDIKTQLTKNPGKVIDVRTLDEWNEGHYSKAIHADWYNGDFQKFAETLDKNENIYLYCRSGGRSGSATDYLKQRGFKNVYNLGGYSNFKGID